MSLSLVLTGDDGSQHVISGPSVIGRDTDVAISLRDRKASRRHARLFQEHGSWAVKDLESRNGVMVNGIRVLQRVLQEGDQLQVGSASWTIGFRSRSRNTLLGRIAPSTGELDSDAGLPVRDTLEVGASADAHAAALLRITSAFAEVRPIEEVQEQSVSELRRVFPQARVVAILLTNEARNGFEIAAASGGGTRTVVHLSRAVAKAVLQQQRAVLCADTHQDERFADRTSIMSSGVSALIAAPFTDDAGQVLGMVYVDSHMRVLDGKDLRLCAAIAPVLGMAYRNAMLLERSSRQAATVAHLQRYVSAEVASQVADGDLSIQLGGTEREGTVFFSDLVGFTPMAERMAGPALVRLLNRYFSVMERVVFDHQGTVDKYQGDAIMAFWGILLPCESPEQRAVQAALEMQRRLWWFNRSEPEDCQLQMGIGLASGRMMACNLGSEQRMDFTVIGRTVNRGARIEGKSGWCRVMVDQATLDAVGATVLAARFDGVRLKGMREPVSVYSVRGLALGGKVDLCVPVRVAGQSGLLVAADLGTRRLTVWTPDAGPHGRLTVRSEAVDWPFEVRASCFGQQAEGGGFVLTLACESSLDWAAAGVRLASMPLSEVGRTRPPRD